LIGLGDDCAADEGRPLEKVPQLKDLVEHRPRLLDGEQLRVRHDGLGRRSPPRLSAGQNVAQRLTPGAPL
jgi:hypothetical protein